MSDLSESELDFLGRYFAMGKGSEIISHPPHKTIGLQQEAFDALKARGLLIEQPFNQYGVKKITCTPEAAEIGRQQMNKRVRAMLAVD